MEKSKINISESWVRKKSKESKRRRNLMEEVHSAAVRNSFLSLFFSNFCSWISGELAEKSSFVWVWQEPIGYSDSPFTISRELFELNAANSSNCNFQVLLLTFFIFYFFLIYRAARYYELVFKLRLWISRTNFFRQGQW